MTEKTPKITEERINELVRESTSGEVIPDIQEVEQDLIGRSPGTTDAQERAQADFIPGTRKFDTTYIPDQVFDETLQHDRQCKLPHDYHYCWVTGGEGGLINWFKTHGYKFVAYDGGKGLAAGGFQGTSMFERTLDGHVRHGDVFLMYTERRRYEAIAREDHEAGERLMAAATGDFHNKAYALGVRSFQEDESSDPLNPIRINN